ncbi:uncharacterized protein PAC_13279 [Phialocephala subalpina]|uniref:Uncharacterized protein n=1 Tax=Phialocephala subalpina TaxID=576137 RepID=A0A1L7XEC8_9HELO|nr:uncharacterized protein PAC_13279 [Phialocephala subalpina]
MPTLFTIPRELRDAILGHVVYAAINLPTPTAPFDESTRTEILDLDSQSWGHGKSVKYLKSSSRLGHFPTLIVNRQIRAETLDLLEKLPNKHSYKMDLMLINETDIWATWLSVPLIANRVDEVYVSFRNVGIATNEFNEEYQHEMYAGKSLLRGGCGGPPYLTWCLYDLLERFLRYGPTSDLPPELEAPWGAQGTYWQIHGMRLDDGKYYHHSAHYLAHYVACDLWMLLRMSDHTGRFGKILYERIGKIEVRLDGELIADEEEAYARSIDIAERFDNLKWHGEQRSSKYEWPEKEFERWKPATYKKRVEYGLPVISL